VLVNLVNFSGSNGPGLDIDSLFGKLLTNEEKQELKSRTSKMNRDSYNQAMSSQLPELGYQADQLMKKLPKPEKAPHPSRSNLLRQTSAAIRTLRSEVYSRAISVCQKFSIC
jgi:Rod binding domain-containing protein